MTFKQKARCLTLTMFICLFMGAGLFWSVKRAFFQIKAPSLVDQKVDQKTLNTKKKIPYPASQQYWAAEEGIFLGTYIFTFLGFTSISLLLTYWLMGLTGFTGLGRESFFTAPLTKDKHGLNASPTDSQPTDDAKTVEPSAEANPSRNFVVNEVVDESQLRIKVSMSVSQGVIEKLSPLMTTIIGQIKLMGVKSREAQQEHFANVEKNARKAHDILERLRFFSGIEGVESTSVELKPLIYGVLNFFDLKIQNLNIQVETQGSEDIYVLGHSELLQLALTEIISNALESMEQTEHRHLSVQVKEEPAKKEQDRKQKIKLTVKDSGKGMPQEKLKKAVQPFFTDTTDTGENRMGLGLSVSAGVFNLLKVDWNIISEEGHGTTWEIFFDKSNVA